MGMQLRYLLPGKAGCTPDNWWVILPWKSSSSFTNFCKDFSAQKWSGCGDFETCCFFQTQQNIRTNRNWCLSSENPKIQEKVFRYSFFTICNKIRTNSKKNTDKWKDTLSNHLFVPLTPKQFPHTKQKKGLFEHKNSSWKQGRFENYIYLK